MRNTKATRCAKRWTATARLLAALTMMLSASACGTLTGAPNPASDARLNPFCARWPDAAHPPVEIFDEDSSENADQKIDVLIVWEAACGIERR